MKNLPLQNDYNGKDYPIPTPDELRQLEIDKIIEYRQMERMEQFMDDDILEQIHEQRLGND